MFYRFIFLLFSFFIYSQKLFAQYTLNNNATQIACNEYQLTNNVNDQKGSVWNNVKINLTQSFDFNFQVLLGSNNSPGADGIAFVLQPISTSVGSGGGGLGFQNVSPSVGVTIDTYPNAVDNDPPSDHIAIQLNGIINHNSINNIAGPVTAINGNDNIEDGAWHNFRVVWNATTFTYTAYIDGVLRVSAVKNFVADVFSGDPLVYWGFTASTGGENNIQSFRTVLTPSYSLSPTQKRCVNEPIAFTNSSISFSPVVNVEWNFGDASPLVFANNPTHTYTTAGDYTVTQKVTALDGCQATNTQTIRVGSKPIVGFFNSNACNTNFVSFTDTSTVAVGTINNWYWDFDNSGITSTIQNPNTTYTTGGPKAIMFVVKTIEGCTDTLFKTINVNNAPAAPIVSATAIQYCLNATATALTATGTNLLWYTTATGGIGGNVAPIPATITAGTTTYYVTQTIDGCESIASSIVVNVIQTQPPTTAAISICQNSVAVPLTASGSNLLWYTQATGGTSSTIAPTPVTILAGLTNYYVTQTLNGCESPRAVIAVTIVNQPWLPGLTSPLIYCQGYIAPQLTASGTNLLWYNSAVGGVGSSIAPTPSTNVLGTTAYYVSQTVNGCESPRYFIEVMVLSQTTPPNVVTPISYCQNATALTLTATGTNLLWYTNATGGTGSSIAPTPSTTTIGTTIYYVSQSIGTCESPRAAISVITEPLSSIPIVNSPVSYCQNTPTTALTSTGTNILWYTAATGGVGSTIAPIPSSATAGTFTYYVTQKTGNCESIRKAIDVIVTAIPAAPIVSPKNYCPNDLATPLTAIGANLLWYNNLIGGVGSAVAPTPNTTFSPATYSFYVSQSVNTCESPRALIVVTVSNSLSLFIGVDSTICQGDTIKFNPTVMPLATTYEWRAIDVPLNTIQNPFVKDAVVKPLDTAKYILKASLGTCFSEDTVTVNVRWKPIVDAGLNNAICLNDSVLLVGTVSHTSGPIATYTWSPIDSLRTPTTIQTWANPIVKTNYKLTITTTVADYGCAFISSDSVDVIVQNNIIAFAGKDTIAVKNAPHQLNASGGVNFIWSSPTANIINPLIKNPKAILNNDAIFYVEVRDAIGCVGYDTIFVKVYDGPTYNVPNTFTPNGDGINDIFRAIPVGIANTTYFRVFNRYGQLMFETNQWLKGWDGTYKGKLQPNGTYVWMVDGTDKDFKKITMKGTVNLVR